MMPCARQSDGQRPSGAGKQRPGQGGKTGKRRPADGSAGFPATGRAGRRVIPATAEAVRGLLEEMERAPDLAALTPDERDCTLMVLAEALNNVVEHGYGGGAGWIALLPGPGRTGRAWRIVDDAAASVPEACRGARMPDVPRDGGFGWPLILALTRRVVLRRRGGLNILSLDVQGEAGLAGVEGWVAKTA